MPAPFFGEFGYTPESLAAMLGNLEAREAERARAQLQYQLGQMQVEAQRATQKEQLGIQQQQLQQTQQQLDIQESAGQAKAAQQQREQQWEEQKFMMEQMQPVFEVVPGVGLTVSDPLTGESLVTQREPNWVESAYEWMDTTTGQRVAKVQTFPGETFTIDEQGVYTFTNQETGEQRVMLPDEIAQSNLASMIEALAAERGVEVRKEIAVMATEAKKYATDMTLEVATYTGEIRKQIQMMEGFTTIEKQQMVDKVNREEIASRELIANLAREYAEKMQEARLISTSAEAETQREFDEKMTRLVRDSTENVASLSRLSQERISAANRSSREMIEQRKLYEDVSKKTPIERLTKAAFEKASRAVFMKGMWIEEIDDVRVGTILRADIEASPLFTDEEKEYYTNLVPRLIGAVGAYPQLSDALAPPEDQEFMEWWRGVYSEAKVDVTERITPAVTPRTTPAPTVDMPSIHKEAMRIASDTKGNEETKRAAIRKYIESKGMSWDEYADWVLGQ